MESTTTFTSSSTGLYLSGTPSNVILFGGISIGTVLIIVLILVISVVIMIYLTKRRQQGRHEVEEFDIKRPDPEENGKDTERGKSKKKGANKKKEGKLLNKYEVPTHCMLQDTSFITKDNFDLFVEKRVEEDAISGNSSMVLELPRRQYLDDEEFSKELFPKPLDVRALFQSSGSSNGRDERVPQLIVVKDTSHFINERNFNLFIETKPAPDNISFNSDYDGVAPELPQRGYMENSDNDMDGVPELPGRYTEGDINNPSGSEGGRVHATQHGKQAQRTNSYMCNPVNPKSISGQMRSSEIPYHGSSQNTRGATEEMIDSQTRMRPANNKKTKNRPELSDNSLDDYMPLDPSTLDRRPVLTSRQTDAYIYLTKNPDDRQWAASAAGDEADYMPLNPQGLKDSSYMSLRHTTGETHSDDDDEYSYMPVTPGTMDMQAAALAYSVGLKNDTLKKEAPSKF